MSLRHSLFLALLCTTAVCYGGWWGPPADKEATARVIFDRLVAARGAYAVPPPEFMLVTGKRSGAYCTAQAVVLEEAAFDVCAALGPDAEAALAGLLAHELIHYYAGHADEAPLGLVNTATDTTGGRRGAGAAAIEREADYLGGFLAHMAGFPTVEVMPRVLEGIYRAYRLPEELTDYPSLTERKALAERSHAQMQQLVAVFDMAGALTALERYGEAATYYTYLLREFQSREMHNNAGVLYLKAALPHFRAGTLTYVYPTELDLRSRLEPQTRGVAVDRATREFYLEEARKHFQRACLLDPDYAPGLLNLATTHALLAQSLTEQPAGEEAAAIATDRLLEAGIRARESLRLADKVGEARTTSDTRVLLGVLAALSGDSIEARTQFELAAANPAAVINQRILTTGTPPAAVPPRSDAPFVMEELIGGQPLVDMVRAAAGPKLSILVSGGEQRMTVTGHSSPVPHTTLFSHALDGGDNTLVVARVMPGYTGKTALEISLGDPGAHLVGEYGTPAYSVGTVRGELLVYPESKLVVEVRGGKVAGWFVYLTGG